MYDSPDQILNALVAGEIDGTSLQFFEGGLFNGTERRTIEFQRSCSSLAMLMEFVSARSSGIYSFEMLEVYLDNFPTAAVGVFTDGTRQIVESILPDTPIEMYADITSTIEAVISGEIVAFMPDTIAQVPQPYFSQLISYGSNEYQPLVMFFRNDKVYPCGNEIVEPEYGEECEAESTDFCNSNCQCSSGYKSMNNQCVADDDTNVAGIVVGSLVGVAVILAAAVGAIVFGLWFYRNHKRPSSSYQLARPLVTPDDL
ncbi:hypothetical protein Pelo_17455 [Pelomyxa schiedti]|nr:hypothetical protein Pelo_17455 [Pelomyxa schiedti]